MRVIIAGSRDITDPALIEEAVLASGYKIREVVCGMARGVDLLGKAWAAANLKKCTEFPARWQQHGKAAGVMRNKEMALYADAAIIIWDGQSPGTKNMIENMNKLGKPHYTMIIRSAPNVIYPRR